MAAEIEDSLWTRNDSLSIPCGESLLATFEFYEQGARPGNRLSSLQEALRRRVARRRLAPRGFQMPALPPLRAGRARGTAPTARPRSAVVVTRLRDGSRLPMSSPWRSISG